MAVATPAPSRPARQLRRAVGAVPTLENHRPGAATAAMTGKGHSGPAGSRGDVCRHHERCCQQTGSTATETQRRCGADRLPGTSLHARSKAAGPPGPTAGDGGSHRPAAGAVPRSAPSGSAPPRLLDRGPSAGGRRLMHSPRLGSVQLPVLVGHPEPVGHPVLVRLPRPVRHPGPGAAPSIVVPGIRHRWTGAGRTPTAESPTAESPTAESPTAVSPTAVSPTVGRPPPPEHRSERAGPDFRNQPSASATASVVRRAWSRPPTKVSPPAAPTSTAPAHPAPAKPPPWNIGSNLPGQCSTIAQPRLRPPRPGLRPPRPGLRPPGPGLRPQRARPSAVRRSPPEQDAAASRSPARQETTVCRSLSENDAVVCRAPSTRCPVVKHLTRSPTG